MTPDEGRRDQFERLAPVSERVWQNLRAYAQHLEHWQKTLNLVAPSTLPGLWDRHLLDSWQLMPLLAAQNRGCLVDLGSGAGLPGLVLAIAGIPDVHLVESNHRKAAFLRFVAEQTGARCQVHAGRAESLPVPELGAVATVTARALAALPDLLRLSLPLCGPDTRLIFLKGRRWPQEVTAAEARYSFGLSVHESVTDREAVILELRHLTER